MPSKNSKPKSKPKRPAPLASAPRQATRAKSVPAPSATRKSPRSSCVAPAARRAKKSAPAQRQSAPAARQSPAQLLLTLAPRIKIGDAMRMLGLDEPRLARLFRGLLSRLNKPRSEKLLLEAIKETCRLLEAYPPSKPVAGPGGLAPNVPVHLITFVPRPERALPPARAASPGASPSAAASSVVDAP